MATTIKKIAEYSGMSVGTVSRALNNDPLIATKTREKIQNLAKELDYVPNILGRALQSKKSFLIGYLLANIKSSFYDDILEGIGETLCRHKYGLLTAITDGNPQSEAEQLQLFREKNVDGILVSNYHRETIKILRKIIDSGIPVICCDIEPFDSNIASVKLDDEKAMNLIMDHLINLNHKDIAFGFVENQNSTLRYDFCNKRALKNNMPELLKFKSNEELISIFNKHPYPTAVISYSDHDAVEIIHILKNLGITVPNDLSIVGFDDMEFASWPEFNLTTILQPKKELGKISAELLIDAITRKTQPHSNAIEPSLIVRKSTTIKKH